LRYGAAVDVNPEIAARIEGRLDRLGISVDDADEQEGLPAGRNSRRLGSNGTSPGATASETSTWQVARCPAHRNIATHVCIKGQELSVSPPHSAAKTSGPAAEHLLMARHMP
jgi:hypothetical protein